MEKIMDRTLLRLCILFLASVFPVCRQFAARPGQTLSAIRVLWNEPGISGSVEVRNGELLRLRVIGSGRTLEGSEFRIAGRRFPGIELQIASPDLAPGPGPTLVTVRTSLHAFSFFLRDVNSSCPIYLPAYGVAVVPAEDGRDYAGIEREILSRGLSTKARRADREPEASFDRVAARTRNMSVPVWLGLGRDMRMFEITEELQDTPNEDKIVKPTMSSAAFGLPETAGRPLFYRYALGRGVGALNNIRRSLEEGVLPIYHAEMRDDDIVYHSVSFAALESSSLGPGAVQGTHYMISDAYSPGRVFTEMQQRQLEEVRARTKTPAEETVLYCRTEIRNTGRVPRYAWVKVPFPGVDAAYGFEPGTGFSGYSEERVFCISRWNGLPMPNEELAVLLQPGDTAFFEFRMPHSPVSRTRAERLGERPFDEVFENCKAYWKGRLAAAAQVCLPEKRIDEMVHAGLLHLDLNTIGEGPDKPLAAKAGVYSPIGTESAPIIQFYCSMGWTDLARRSLDYFMATQQDNGQIMNYYGYTIETGAVLWCAGEYFRYTRDTAWIERVRPRLLKACGFLTEWRARDGKDGSGMISGKVADPEDSYHQFMLNAYGYLGMSRMAEVMEALGKPEAERLRAEADDWRRSIRKAALDSWATSPVVPLGDGTWCPTLPPWTEAPGPRLLYQKPEKFRSHGTFTVPDAGLSPAYLVFGEVFGPEEPLSRMLMTYIGELMCQGNTGFSQPYYGRLNWWWLQTGRTGPFLDAYYTAVSAHADRETYSFWEHFYRLSSHKTHEEAGFLMETRWMLYQERGDTLNIFRTIPRSWLEAGKRIVLKDVRSYFGSVDAVAEGIREGRLEAVVSCAGERKPRCVAVRLPHPGNRRPSKVSGGRYVPETETVVIDDFGGQARVVLEFE